MASYQDGLDFYKSSQFDRARKILDDLAETDDPRACYLLGVMQSQGDGCPEDPARAAAYYERAAQAGHSASQFNLAALYATGKGVKQDLMLAYQWYQRSTEQGDTDAMFRLGLMDWKGEGRPVSFSSAKEWWKKAATLGNTDAMLFLGNLYRKQGDLPSASHWYIEAWQNENEDGEIGLRQLQSELKALAKSNSSQAQYALGILEKYGNSDEAAAAKWFQRAAKNNHAAAGRLFGFALERGEGVKVNLVEAAGWYQRAADLGDHFAMFNYARFLRDGLGGVTSNTDLSIDYYRKAAEAGLNDALLPLARLLAFRNRDRTDANEAVQRLWTFASEFDEIRDFELQSGDGEWSAKITNQGESLELFGITLDELHGLPVES